MRSPRKHSDIDPFGCFCLFWNCKCRKLGCFSIEYTLKTQPCSNSNMSLHAKKRQQYLLSLVRLHQYTKGCDMATWPSPCKASTVGSSWLSDRAVASRSSFLSLSEEYSVLQGNLCTAERNRKGILVEISFWGWLCILVALIAKNNGQGDIGGRWRRQNTYYVIFLPFEVPLSLRWYNQFLQLALTERGCFWCVFYRVKEMHASDI